MVEDPYRFVHKDANKVNSGEVVTDAMTISSEQKVSGQKMQPAQAPHKVNIVSPFISGTNVA